MSVSNSKSIPYRDLLMQVFRQEKFVDTFFQVGSVDAEVKPQIFRVSRVFFAMVSKKFEKLLFDSSISNTTEPSTFYLNDISYKGFESICLYAYGNDPKITPNNVLYIIDICEKYQVTELQKQCETKIKESYSSNLDYLLSMFYCAVEMKNENKIKQLCVQLCRQRWESMANKSNNRNHPQMILNKIFQRNLNSASLQKMFEYEVFFDKDRSKFSFDSELLWTSILKWSERFKGNERNTVLKSIKSYFIPIFQSTMTNKLFLQKYVLCDGLNFLSKEEKNIIINQFTRKVIDKDLETILFYLGSDGMILSIICNYFESIMDYLNLIQCLKIHMSSNYDSSNVGNTTKTKTKTKTKAKTRKTKDSEWHESINNLFNQASKHLQLYKLSSTNIKIGKKNKENHIIQINPIDEKYLTQQTTISLLISKMKASASQNRSSGSGTLKFEISSIVVNRRLCDKNDKNININSKQKDTELMSNQSSQIDVLIHAGTELYTKFRYKQTYTYLTSSSNFGDIFDIEKSSSFEPRLPHTTNNVGVKCFYYDYNDWNTQKKYHMNGMKIKLVIIFN